MAKNLSSAKGTEGANPATAKKRFTPNEAASASARYAKLQPSSPFYFSHNSSAWTVLDGRLVPSLRKAALIEGVNGARRFPNGDWDLSRLRASLNTRGDVVISPNEGPEGSYLQEVQTQPDGFSNPTPAYISVWETAQVGSNRTRTDIVGYADWLEGLVERGLVAPPTAFTVDSLLSQTREQLLAAEAGRSPDRAERLTLLRSIEAVLSAKLDELEGEGDVAAVPVKGKPTSLPTL